MIDKVCSITDKVSVSGLEKCNFYRRKGIQKNWVDNNEVLVDYVGNKVGQSLKVSILARKMIVT